MKTQTTKSLPQRAGTKAMPSGVRRTMPAVLACLATLLALPVNAAVVFPDNPLQTGSAFPPPNVMFILDDSGSMVFDNMPEDRHPLRDRPSDRSYLNNTIYYDPHITYLPWLTASGARMAGGTSMGSVYADLSMASDTIDLSDSSSCRTVDRNGTSISVCGGSQVFYVPKTGVTASTDASDFVRYLITSAEVVAPGTPSRISGYKKGPLDSGMNSATERTFTISVPAGTGQLVVSTEGGGQGIDLQLRRPDGSAGGALECRSKDGDGAEFCAASDPIPGDWKVRVYRDDSATFSNVFLDASLASYELQTPTGRSQADEMKNYATWFSYYRTRMKTAKGGASEAFGQIGSNIRVGYDSIWNRDKGSADDKTASVSTNATPKYKIPVGTAQGTFTGTNRTEWFDELQGARGYSGTPLHGALQRAGKYFATDGSTGPWGPESGTDQISCRQSFAILTTDGYWNSTSGYSSAIIGDSDSVDGTSYTSKDGTTTLGYKAVSPYIDNFTTSPNTQANTLADVANYYWKNDLRSALDNNVPASTADPAFWQHMTTFGLSIGLRGLRDPATDLISISNGSKSWPDPIPAENASRIDDLWHAAVNGHGSFVAASNPTKFAQGLVDALATVASRNGSASNVTANSTSFQSDTTVYQASYVSGKWTGELAAYAVASGSGVATTPAWLASEKVPAAASRTILTWDTLNDVVTTFPSDTQKAALERTGGLAPVSGADNASYITGVQTEEKQSGGLLRDRIKTVLGDVANSSPIYVRDTETLFVGANDGMLHAFNALTGAERFAYVPRGLDLDNLASFSDPQYVHKWFVDGPIVVSTQAQTSGTNYLVGALGRGGKGLFGLDVTTPTSFGTSKVLWDHTGSAAPANMGQVLGEPLIVKLNDTTNAIIVSNGVNSSTGTASLFIINIATGDVIKELDTGYTTGGNGLSAPRGWDNDGNGTVDYVYAGDLQGNLWKFDLTAATSAGWVVANSVTPMFVAKDATNKRQPITSGLGLAKDPATGKRWIFIGTGSFMSNTDATSLDVQSMYGVIDDSSVITARTSAGDGDLQKRTIALINGSETQRGFEPNANLDSAKKGWYIDLLKPPSGTQQGERLVNRPIIRGTVLITASMIPPTGDTCEAGGRGFINALDAFSGTSLSSSYFDTNNNGNFNDDKIGTGADEVPVGSIDVGVGMPTLPTIIDDLLIVGGSTGALGQIKVNPQGVGPRRISWREILRD